MRIEPIAGYHVPPACLTASTLTVANGRSRGASNSAPPDSPNARQLRATPAFTSRPRALK